MDNVLKDPKGTYRDEDGTLCLIYCPECKRENWAMVVATGQCAWCGYSEKKEDENVGTV